MILPSRARAASRASGTSTEACRCSPGGSRRGGGVLAVVRTGDARLGRQRVVAAELDAAPVARHRREAARDDRDVVRALVLEDAELRRAVGVEVAVAVQMVRGDVEENGDVRPKVVDVLELEARELADDPAAAVLRLGERPADVPGHRRAEHLAEERRSRRLPVRAGDADDRRREQPRAELDLAPDREPAAACGGHEGRLARNSGALHQQVHVLDERGVLRAEHDFDARRAKPPGVELAVPVDADDPDAAAGERQRRRLPRAGEA